MEILLNEITDPTIVGHATLSSELREKSNPGVADEHLTFHWGDVKWLEISLPTGEILGYTYYVKLTNILAELHGFAQTEAATKFSIPAMDAICTYLKEKEKIRKVFVTMPGTASHVAVYLARAGYKPAAKIKDAVVYNKELVDLYYLTREL